MTEPLRTRFAPWIEVTPERIVLTQNAALIARMAANDVQKHDISRFRFSRFTDGSKLELGPVL